MQSTDIQEKAKKTRLQKYGVEHCLQSSIIIEKIKNSNLKKYGVDHPLKNKDIIKKIQKTNLERYGHVCSLHNSNINDKTIKTNLSKYGVKNPFQSEIVKEKIKKSNLDKYGVEYPMQCEKIHNKSKESLKNKYGVLYPTQASEIRKKLGLTNVNLPKDSIKIINNKDLLLKCIKDVKNKFGFATYSNIAEKLNYSCGGVYHAVKRFGLKNMIDEYIVAAENEIKKYLESLGYNVVLHDRRHLYKENGRSLEIDIFLPDLNVGIEYDGDYWHSDDFLLKRDGITYEEQCRIKDELAKNNGIKLIHIKESDYKANKRNILDMIEKKLKE